MTGNPLMTANFMPRPRVGEIFDQAAGCKLVYVIAGAGYGKTQAVNHYVSGQTDAVVRWVQLTESDNVGSRYWESLTHVVAADNPRLADSLRQLGFPETPPRFRQFAAILRAAEHRSHKTFLVLDDFHLIRSKEALLFAERCAHLNIPGACVIIISRNEPEINAVSLFSAGRASRITEEELCFTGEEIAEFLKRGGVAFAVGDLPGFFEATKGWALAVNLLSLVLRRDPAHPANALDVMKQNIFRLLQTEAWDGFSEPVQKLLARLSLVFDLPQAPLYELIAEGALLESAPGLTSFVWFDSLSGDYRIHPLYHEFLLSRQDILCEEEKLDTYRRAAQWCAKNDFYMDAVYYYAKLRRFGAIIEVLFSYPFRLPYDACEYFFNILEKLEPDFSDPAYLLLKHFFAPILLMGMRRYEEAVSRSFGTIREWEGAGTPLAFVLLGAAYSNLAYIDMYTCTVTHRYDAPGHLKKSVEYLKMSAVPPVRRTGPFTVADVRSYACLVGEGAGLFEFEIFLESARETAFYVTQASHDMYYGYDDLVACELAFFRGRLGLARQAAHDAAVKAREKGQYSIGAMAQQYLLRIAVQDGDYPLAREILRQLREHLDNTDFWNRQLLYDLYTGFFYAQIGLPDLIPTWFIMDGDETASEVRIPTRELIVSAKYYISSKKYNLALAVLSKTASRDPQERFYLGELSFTLLFAVAKIKTGDVAGAVADFERAYRLSFGGIFEMFFVELGRNLHPLAVAAAARPECAIPAEWLKTIDRKASIYAKKADVIADAVRREKNIKDTVPLSEREREVLTELYHGLSREEIAANRYLSVNTVKKILQSVYNKLGANNNVDAVRIAVEKKLVE